MSISWYQDNTQVYHAYTTSLYYAPLYYAPVSEQKMCSKWRLALELTYPTVSMFSGIGFNKLIRDALGDTHIEDLWLPYFTLTTDITDSAARIHTHGRSLDPCYTPCCSCNSLRALVCQLRGSCVLLFGIIDTLSLLH